MRPIPTALVLALAAAPAAAQPCGPITFAFAGTGPGCAPFGGSAPALMTGLIAPTPPTICTVWFWMITGTPPSVPAFLILGVSNPALNLTPFGFAGCTLLANPEVVLPMPWVALIPPFGPPAYQRFIPVPATPSVIGAIVFCQAVVLGPSPTFSSGASVSIS